MAKFNPGDKVRNAGTAAPYWDRVAYPEAVPVETIVREMPSASAPSANAFTYGIVVPLAMPEYELSGGVIAPEGYLILVERAAPDFPHPHPAA